ncbi:MAG: ISAzo13-like element transposase-related protein [Gammaproteobacteria bacterium]
MVNLIGSTISDTGLQIRSQPDENSYQSGINVADDDLANLAVARNKIQGE